MPPWDAPSATCRDDDSYTKRPWLHNGNHLKTSFWERRLLVLNLGQLDTTSRAKCLLDVTVEGELSGSEGTNHEETSVETTEETANAEVLGDAHQSADGGLAWSALGLVDLGQESVGWLRDEGGGETGNDTTSQVERGDGTWGEGVLGLSGELNQLLEGDLEDGELGHGVWDLLEDHWAESRVEACVCVCVLDWVGINQHQRTRLFYDFRACKTHP